jgi:hypothetical protein
LVSRWPFQDHFQAASLCAPHRSPGLLANTLAEGPGGALSKNNSGSQKRRLANRMRGASQDPNLSYVSNGLLALRFQLAINEPG